MIGAIHKKAFKSIQTKFVISFVIGAMATLLVAMLVGYAGINTVYKEISRQTMNAELEQVAGEIDMLLSETERLIASRVMLPKSVEKLAGRDKLSVPDFVYAVLNVREEFDNISESFEHIDSLYLYVTEDWFLGMSHTSTKLLYEKKEWPEERITSLLKTADVSSRYAGAKAEEFPLDMQEPACLMMYRSINTRYGKCAYAVNVRESALRERYSGLSKDAVRTVWIVDMEGQILSAVDKKELGNKLALLDESELTEPGMLLREGMVVNYRPLTEYGIVIVSAMPASIYTEGLIGIRNSLFAVFVFGMTAVSVFFVYWIRKRLTPIGRLREGMKMAGQGDYDHPLPVTGEDELSELARYYNHMLEDLKGLSERQEQTATELREREMAMLRNEINPHFLYNTLNTVKCMAELEGNEDIARCVKALGGMIAPLYKTQGALWTLEEEIKLVEKYIEIMNVRYGNGIRCMEHIPKELLNKAVLRFILQPIIENSILHGFASSAYSGRIFVTARQEKKFLVLSVEDDGEGIPEEELAEYNDSLKNGIKANGIGMMNVCRRIILQYGEAYGIHLERSGYGGLCVQIWLPEEDIMS